MLEGLRYVLTANGSDQYLDQDAGGPLPGRHAFQYSGTGQLEYRDGQDGRRGADRVNLTLRYFGPSDTGFTRVSALAFAMIALADGVERARSTLRVHPLVLAGGGILLALASGRPRPQRLQ